MCQIKRMNIPRNELLIITEDEFLLFGWIMKLVSSLWLLIEETRVFVSRLNEIENGTVNAIICIWLSYKPNKLFNI